MNKRRFAMIVLAGAFLAGCGGTVTRDEAIDRADDTLGPKGAACVADATYRLTGSYDNKQSIAGEQAAQVEQAINQCINEFGLSR